MSACESDAGVVARIMQHGMTPIRVFMCALALCLGGMMLYTCQTDHKLLPQSGNLVPQQQLANQQQQLAAIAQALSALSSRDNQSRAPATQGGGGAEWDYNWDKKQYADGGVGVGVRTLLLVRHGQYDYATGALTPLGRQQVNETGSRLVAAGRPYRTITHSTMPRARETANIIHQHLNLVPMFEDSMLEEGGPVPPRPTLSHWGLPERDYHVDGPRMESAFRKYFFRADRDQTVQSFDILVGHGNLFRFFALRALQLTPSAWMRVSVAHASITLLHINPDGTVFMTKFGDAGHLPPAWVTS